MSSDQQGRGAQNTPWTRAQPRINQNQQGVGGQQMPPLPPLPQQPPPPQRTIQSVDTIPDDVAQWTAQMLRVLGWNSKKTDHAALDNDIAALLQGQQDTPLIGELRRKHQDLSNSRALNGVWDTAQEMQASEIKATLAFEAMPNRRAELQTGSANPTFWVKGAPDPQTGETREYIFKPAVTGAGLLSGMPEGGEPAREALAGRVAEQLRVFTGLDFNMPLTNLISVDPSRLADYQVGNILSEPEKNVSGSLQQFKESDGDLRRKLYDVKADVDAQSCQKMAMLDTIILNLDRHDGNILLGKNGSGMVPIDHGLGFPTFETVSSGDVQQNMAGEKNALLRLPNAYEPFSQQSLDGIAEIDPDLMTAALKGENQKIEQVHPTTEGTVTPEAFTVSNLSTRFLKRAAPRLPPAVLQIALAAESKQLLNAQIARDPQRWDTVADAVIAEYAQKAPALKEFWMLAPDEREAIYAKVQADGLMDGFKVDDAWIARNVDVVMAYYRAGQAPVRPQTPPRAQAPNPDMDTAKRDAEGAIKGLKLDKKKSGDWLPVWNRILALGGVDQVRQAMLRPDAPKKIKSLDEVLALLRTMKAEQDARERRRNLEVIYTNFPDVDRPTGSANSINVQEDHLLEGWGLFMANGGLRALRAAQQNHPNVPRPRDPRAAVLLMKAPANTTNVQAALKTLDMLDQMVAADPEVASQGNKLLIATTRTNIQTNRVRGDQDPKDLAQQLADGVIADGIKRFKVRFDAIERKYPEQTWKAQWEMVSAGLFAGKLLNVAPLLQQMEQHAAPQNVR